MRLLWLSACRQCVCYGCPHVSAHGSIAVFDNAVCLCTNSLRAVSRLAARSDDLKLRIIEKFGAKSLNDIKAGHKAQLLLKPNLDLQEMCGHLKISKKGSKCVRNCCLPGLSLHWITVLCTNLCAIILSLIAQVI